MFAQKTQIRGLHFTAAFCREQAHVTLLGTVYQMYYTVQLIANGKKAYKNASVAAILPEQLYSQCFCKKSQIPATTNLHQGNTS